MQIRVLMYGWEFPPHNSGGLGVACYGLARALASAGADIIFVLPKRFPLELNPFRFRFAGVEDIIPIESPIRPYITNKEYSSEAQGLNYGDDLYSEVMRYGYLGGNIAKTEQFDVIHAHDWLSFGAGVRAKELTGKPLVVHVHATEFDRTGGHGMDERIRRIEKWGLEMADSVVTVSEYTKNIVMREYGISGDKIKVVHNGIDLSEYNKKFPIEFNKLRSDGSKIILSVGRITIQKGIDYLIRAAKEVIDAGKKIHLIIVGSGDMERQVIEEAARLRIADRVLFAGFLRGEDLYRVFQSSDLFVLPSISEPFGLVPLESLANGTPVIISKQSGVNEVIPSAVSVDFWDIQKLAKEIIYFIERPAINKKRLANNILEVSKATWENAAKKSIELYKSLLGERFVNEQTRKGVSLSNKIQWRIGRQYKEFINHFT